jgi:hypothetical protein
MSFLETSKNPKNPKKPKKQDKQEKQEIIKNLCKNLKQLIEPKGYGLLPPTKSSFGLKDILDNVILNKKVAILIKSAESSKTFSNMFFKSKSKEDKTSKNDRGGNSDDDVDFVIYKDTNIFPLSYNSDLSENAINKLIFFNDKCNVCLRKVSDIEKTLLKCKYCSFEICDKCLLNLLLKSVKTLHSKANCPECNKELYNSNFENVSNGVELIEKMAFSFKDGISESRMINQLSLLCKQISEKTNKPFFTKNE